MSGKINTSTLGLSVIVSFIFIVGLGLLSSIFFATALIPSYAMIAAYILTGIIIGYYSKDVTIVEPGLGAIVASVAASLLISSFELRGLSGLWASDWVLIAMNGVILTFVGAWVGEMFQAGEVDNKGTAASKFEWEWILAGAVVGVVLSLLLVSILVLFLGYVESNYLIPFIISLFATGYIVGIKSPGVTIVESGLAGFLTITINVNIIRLTLMTETEIGAFNIIGALIVGYLVALLGGFVGEKVQASKS